MIRNRAVSACLAISAAALALVGCGIEKNAEQSNLIVIGANLEMTGSNATFGTSSLNGINMAVEAANEKGGVLGK